MVTPAVVAATNYFADDERIRSQDDGSAIKLTAHAMVLSSTSSGSLRHNASVLSLLPGSFLIPTPVLC